MDWLVLFSQEQIPRQKIWNINWPQQKECIAIICIVDVYSYYAQYVDTCICCTLVTYWESRFARGHSAYISNSEDKACAWPLTNKFSSKCFKTIMLYKQNVVTILLSQIILPLLRNNTMSLIYSFYLTGLASPTYQT